MIENLKIDYQSYQFFTINTLKCLIDYNYAVCRNLYV